MKIVAFVPIKKNSQRLPNKNFLELGGLPLYKWIFNAIDNIVPTYAYTNCELDYPHVLKRPEYLDLDETLGIDIYREFAKEVPADFYLLMHCTSPFLKRETIEKAIDALKTHDSVLTVQKLQRFAWIGDKPLYSGIPRTQDLDPIYLETSALYGYSRELLEQGRRIGDKPFLLETDALESIDIDTIDDLNLARFYCGFRR